MGGLPHKVRNFAVSTQSYYLPGVSLGNQLICLEENLPSFLFLLFRALFVMCAKLLPLIASSLGLLASEIVATLNVSVNFTCS